MEDLHELETLLKSPMPLIVIETHEEPRVIDLFQRIVKRLPTLIFEWAVTDGLQCFDVDMSPQRHNSKPAELVSQIKMSKTPGIYLLLDFHQKGIQGRSLPALNVLRSYVANMLRVS